MLSICIWIKLAPHSQQEYETTFIHHWMCSCHSHLLSAVFITWNFGDQKYCQRKIIIVHLKYKQILYFYWLLFVVFFRLLLINSSHHSFMLFFLGSHTFFALSLSVYFFLPRLIDRLVSVMWLIFVLSILFSFSYFFRQYFQFHTVQKKI